MRHVTVSVYVCAYFFLLQAKYAVRGELVIRAKQLQKELAEGDTSKPFSRMVFCNIGNPQALNQTPLTFPRQVGAATRTEVLAAKYLPPPPPPPPPPPHPPTCTACGTCYVEPLPRYRWIAPSYGSLPSCQVLALLQHTPLLDAPGVEELFPADVLERARSMHAQIPGGIGAYSVSQGVLHHPCLDWCWLRLCVVDVDRRSGLLLVVSCCKAFPSSASTWQSSLRHGMDSQRILITSSSPQAPVPASNTPCAC